MPTEPENPSTPQANPKVVVGTLAVLCLSALILGIFHILNGIKSPFVTIPVTNDESLAAIERRNDQLRQQDLDEDGLSDYDELNVLGTSPYLKDSDSDGVDDNAERTRGTDPNCPEGKTCGFTSVPVNGNANTNSSTVASNVDVVALRQALKDAGAPAYIVDGLNDTELVQMYQEVVGDSGVSLTNTTNSNASSETDVLNSLQNLSAAEVRELLRQGGADEAILQQVDDQQLRDLFRQAITEEFSNTNTAP